MRQLPPGQNRTAQSRFQSFIKLLRPTLRDRGPLLQPILIVLVAFVCLEIVLRVAAQPDSGNLKRSATSTLLTRCLAGGLQRMHSSFSDNVSPAAPAVADDEKNAPIRLSAPAGEVAATPSASLLATAQPSASSPSQGGNAAPQPPARTVPEDLITDIMRAGGYSKLPQYAQPATLSPEEQAGLIQDATTMASAQGMPADEEPTIDINIQRHELGAIRLAVTNVLQQGFKSRDGFVQRTRMPEAKPLAPKPTGNVDHEPFGTRRLQEAQARKAELDGPRYRTVEEPISEDQAKRFREQLSEVWSKVSAQVDPSTQTEEAPSDALAPQVNWRALAEVVLQQFTTKHALSVGNVMDIRAAKKSFDHERAQGHSARRQRVQLIELICLAGRAGDLPCQLLPKEWKPDFDVAKPRAGDFPDNEHAFTLAMDNWHRQYPCSGLDPMPAALRKTLERQAAEEEERIFREEDAARRNGVPIRGGTPIRATPEVILKTQMEAIAAAARGGDSAALSALMRNLLPKGRPLRHGLSPYTYTANRAPLEARSADLAAKPDAYWAQALAITPEQTEVRIVKLKELRETLPDPKLIDVLSFDQQFYEISFVAPGGTEGPTLRFVYWTGGQWQMLGEFWKAFDSEKPAKK